MVSTSCGIRLVIVGVALVMGTVACRIPAPAPPKPFIRPGPPPKDLSDGFSWAAPEGEEEERGTKEVLVKGRPVRNTRSPLGANLPLFGPGTAFFVFTDRFHEATPWASVDQLGEARRDPLLLNEEGWVVRLQKNQVAKTEFPVIPGEKYVLRYAGDGRLVLKGVADERPVGLGEIAFRAVSSTVELQIRRVSPSSPPRDFQVLPEGLAEAQEIPKFDSRFLDRIDKFSVLRFADWARVGSNGSGRWGERAQLGFSQLGSQGVAIEHMLDIANQVSADVWLTLPVAADVKYARSFAQFVAQYLDPKLKVYVEYATEDLPAAGEGAWSTLDTEPDIAWHIYRAQRTVELLPIIQQVLGPTRVIRVLSVPVASPQIVLRMLEVNRATESIDGLAVAPWVRAELQRRRRTRRKQKEPIDRILERLADIELPNAKEAIQEVASIASERKLRLVAYTGGIDLDVAPGVRRTQVLAKGLEAAAIHPSTTATLLELLDAWKYVGGQSFVVEPLFGPAGPLTTMAATSREAPQYEALLSFSEDTPRWWTRRSPEMIVAQPATAPASEPSPDALALSDEPPPPKLYTARWAKWVTLGLGAVAGVVAVERFASASRAADRRDRAIERLSQVGSAVRFDATQARVRDAEDSRAISQRVGYVAVGVSSALVAWAFAQWLEELPKEQPSLPSWASDDSSQTSREGTKELAP